MLKLSTQLRYGLRALVYLASKKTFCSTKEIAESEEIPQAYLEKILLKLKNHGLVKAKRGKFGGFKIKTKTLNMPLNKIIEALEQKSVRLPCENVFCQKEKKCLSRKIWLKVKSEILHSLSQTSLKNFLSS